MRAPNARPSGDTLHSRRWEGANLALLRRQYAKLPAERLEGLLALRVDELRDHCRQLGWTESKVASLTPDYAMPLIMYTKRFFEQSLRSIDLPKEGIVLPSDIVYHQAMALLYLAIDFTEIVWVVQEPESRGADLQH